MIDLIGTILSFLKDSFTNIVEFVKFLISLPGALYMYVCLLPSPINICITFLLSFILIAVLIGIYSRLH